MIASPTKALDPNQGLNTRSEAQAVPLTRKSLQNRSQLPKEAAEKELSRRRVGTVWMAGVALCAFFTFRLQYDTAINAFAEIIIITGILAGSLFFGSRTDSSPSSRKEDSSGWSKSLLYAYGIAGLCTVMPWMLDRVAREFGGGNGSEILMLGSLGWASLCIALLARSKRTLNQAPIASGFVVMFTTFIASQSSALLFVYVWTAICLWWLLTNHWSAVQCLAASSVQTSSKTRQVYLLLSMGLFISVTAATWDRIPILRRLRSEIMPTSGGTSGKDSAARSGVGDGDALIAARKHAASFGAVDSDMFLDSEKPSLFDVFSEEFGEPKKKKRVERAQALSPNDIESQEGKFAETNRSSSNDEFAIERDPPKKREPPKDLHSDALMFWEGRSGIRLAAARFQHFDGEKWTKMAPGSDKPPKRLGLYSVHIGEKTWFRQAGKLVQNSISPFVDSLPEALKFTRFRSPEIPSCAGMQLWSIDQITFADFFGYTDDDCLFMPERQHVPDYTVVRFVNSRIDLERLESLLRSCAPGRSHQPTSDQCQSAIASLAHEYAGVAPRGFDQVNNVVNGLRREFKLDASQRETDGQALDSFLKSKSGPSYLFATAAALMLDHLGYETRLVTGFYINPKHSSADGSTAIIPSDTHAWLEVNSGHDYWIPLEPTPGYRKPRLNAGVFFLARKHWVLLTVSATSIVVVLSICYWLRARLFYVLCWFAFPIVRLLPDRKRLAWLGWMLDARWLLIGHARPVSTTPRKQLISNRWDLEHQHKELVSSFLDCVDSVRFGKSKDLTASQRVQTVQVFKSIHQIKFSPDSGNAPELSTGSTT